MMKNKELYTILTVDNIMNDLIDIIENKFSYQLKSEIHHQVFWNICRELGIQSANFIDSIYEK
jgi:hypothetical protein